MTTAIEIQGLEKSFGSTRALDGLDMSVAAGEVHGFLGPNGAGKSTTIRVLLGLLRADAGTVSVLGGHPWRDAVEIHRRLAYVPGDVSLWPNLTGGEAIDLLSRLRGHVDPARRRELVERFDLDPTKKGSTYSKGNRQKVAIIAALASEVDLLVLDEPTAGLDPLMEAVFATAIDEERERGRTVLLSSHTLAQVERLCERISIIRHGRIVESGSLTQLRHLTRTTVRVRTRTQIGSLTDLDGVHDVRAAEDGELALDVDAEALDAVIGRLHSAGIVSLISQPPSLEQLFLRHYGDELASRSAAGAENGR